MTTTNSSSNLIGQLGLLQQFLSLGAVAGQTNSRILPPPVQTGIAFQNSALATVQSRQSGNEQPGTAFSHDKSRIEQHRPQAATIDAATQVTYTYMIKLINPKRKSDFIIRTWYDITEKFDTIISLRRSLLDAFGDELTTETFQLGFFEPPSQVKRWLQEQRDLDNMYSIFPTGARITLWCEKALYKETTEADITEPPSKKKASTARDKSEEELDEIFVKLQEKHPKLETVKLRLWGKLIQSEHHDDYKVPPEIPLLTGRHNKKKAPKEGVADLIAGATSAIVKTINTPAKEKSPTKVQGLSPMKAVSIRRSCLDDLKRAKELFEDNVLTDGDFKEEKERISSTLRGLGK